MWEIRRDTWEYVKNMNKYVGNMKEYVGNMNLVNYNFFFDMFHVFAGSHPYGNFPTHPLFQITEAPPPPSKIHA